MTQFHARQLPASSDGRKRRRRLHGPPNFSIGSGTAFSPCDFLNYSEGRRQAEEFISAGALGMDGMRASCIFRRRISAVNGF